MRKASNEYLSDHQNPSTEMGQTRKSGAEIMSDMRPPRLGHPNAVIQKTTIEDMTKAFDASRKSKKANTTAPARKERITKKSVAKAKQEHQSENSRNHSGNQRDSSIRSF